MIPVVRHREPPLDTEEAGKVLAEVGWPLDIAVRPVDFPLPVIEVLIGENELAAGLEQSGDLRELFRLVLTDVLEHALRDDEIEFHATEVDRSLKEILLDKVVRGLGNRDINAMVVHIRWHKTLQGGRTASDIEQIAFAASRQS